MNICETDFPANKKNRTQNFPNKNGKHIKNKVKKEGNKCHVFSIAKREYVVCESISSYFSGNSIVTVLPSE